MKGNKSQDKYFPETMAINRLERLSLASLDSITRIRKRKLLEVLNERKQKSFSSTLSRPIRAEFEIFCPENLYQLNKAKNQSIESAILHSALLFFEALEQSLSLEHKLARDGHLAQIKVVPLYQDILKDNSTKRNSNSELVARILYGDNSSTVKPKTNDQDLMFEWIKEHLSYMRLSSMKALWLAFNAKLPSLRVSYSYFRKFVTQFYSFKYSKTVIRSRYLLSETSQWSKLFFFSKLQEAIRADFTLVFVDESYFRRIHTRTKNWWSTEFDSSEAEYMGLFRDTATLTLATTPQGFHYYEFLTQNNTQETFIDFLTNLRKQLKSKNINNYYLVMDNVNLHRTTAIISYLQKNKVNALFTPKYACQYNLCEYIFSNLKLRHYQRVHSD